MADDGRRRRVLRPHRPRRHRARARATSSATTAAACRAASTNCLAGGAGYASVTGRLERRHAVVHPALRPLPRRAAGRRRLRCRPASPGGCGHLVDGTTRVWETITGGNASDDRELVRHEQPDDPEHDQADARQPLVHQPGQVLAQVVERRRSSARTTATSGSASTSGRASPSQANWVNVTGEQHRPTEPPGARDRARPVGARRASLAIGYAAIGGFNANTPTTPGHVFQVTCTANCATFTWVDKTRQPARHPGRLGHRQPEDPRSRSSPGPTGACTTPTTSRSRRRPGSGSRTGCRTR